MEAKNMSQQTQARLAGLQADLDQLPPEVPTYLTAAVGPSKIASARKWCSVCGNLSP